MKSKEETLSKRESFVVIFYSVGVTLFIMLLFYRSVWAIVWFPIVWILLRKQEKRKRAENKTNQLRRIDIMRQFGNGNCR